MYLNWQMMKTLEFCYHMIQFLKHLDSRATHNCLWQALFHLWRHHLWPKLASSTCILNFCGRIRSFQCYPNHSDWLNGAWNLHKNIQKFRWKTQSKIPSTTHGFSMAKITCFNEAFLEVFEWEASPVESQSWHQKDKKRIKRNGKKKCKDRKA